MLMVRIMKQKPQKSEPNQMVQKMLGFVGRQVTVVMYVSEEIVKLTGVCKSIDFGSKAVIIEDKEKEVLIRNYLYMEKDVTKKEESEEKHEE